MAELITYECPLCLAEIDVPKPMMGLTIGAYSECPSCGRVHGRCVGPESRVYAWLIERSESSTTTRQEVR